MSGVRTILAESHLTERNHSDKRNGEYGIAMMDKRNGNEKVNKHCIVKYLDKKKLWIEEGLTKEK